MHIRDAARGATAEGPGRRPLPLSPAQLILAGGGAVAIVAYLAAVHTTATELLLYDGAVAAAAGAATAGALRRRRCGGALPWALVAASLWLFLAGELLWSAALAAGDDASTAGDVVMLFGYAALAGAATLLAGPVARADRSGWVDPWIFAIGAGCVVWLTVGEPVVGTGGSPSLSAVAFPLADVVVLGLLARLVLGRRRPDRPIAWFTAGVAATLVADLWYAWQETGAGYAAGGPVDGLWMAGYLLMGIAALEPDADGTDADAGADGTDAAGGRNRRAALVVATAVAVPPVVGLVGLYRSGDGGLTTPTVALVAAATTAGLAGFRTWSLAARAGADARRRDAARLGALVEHSTDGVLLVDADRTVVYASPAVTDLTGRPAASWVGADVAGLVAVREREAFVRLLDTLAAAGDGATTDLDGTLAVAGRRSFEGTARNLLDDDAVAAVVLTVRDVTERRALERQLERRAFTDDLTGLANRALLVDRASHALARDRRRSATTTALLLVDLDDFKSVNDGLGHTAGDELLREAAARIQACVRPSDTVARLGGDEFAVLLEDLRSLDEAAEAGRRLLEVLALPMGVGGDALAVGASVGVAPAGDRATVESLLRDADIAMYSAKAGGKGRVVVFDESLRRSAQRDLTLRIELPRALEEGRFRIVYQPIHDIRSGQLVGFEALARWRRANGEEVPPVEFIPAAEGSGNIGALGRFMLDGACAQAVAWTRAVGRPLHMSVNVSGAQLLDPDFAGVVADALARTGLPAELLTLELTESILVDHVRSRVVLETLRALGVGIAVDDFGTGYSSLSYLQRFPVSSVKIDRSFVAELTRSGNASLVRSIIDMAGAMDLQTVAEGVETDEQLAALEDLRCDLAQGYLLGRPAEVDAVEALLGIGDAATPEPAEAAAP
jgi:diguanylate cyclase (GGDEF)-like protein/PAS domain S-box-containing protein